VPAGYVVEQSLYTASITDPANPGILITFAGGMNETEASLDDMAQESQEPQADAPLDMEVGAPTDTSIGGEQALSFDIQMTVMFPITTTLTMATPLDGAQLFSAIGVEMDSSEMFGTLFAVEGALPFPDVYQSVLGSVAFQPMAAEVIMPPLGAAACSVAKDKTYGLSADKPVVLYKYPTSSRLEPYFAWWLGPKGEAVTYEQSAEQLMPSTEEEQQQALPVVYTVTYPGQAQPLTVYILETDLQAMADYTAPHLPVGFTCAP
jgi:hypothetical protein